MFPSAPRGSRQLEHRGLGGDLEAVLVVDVAAPTTVILPPLREALPRQRHRSNPHRAVAQLRIIFRRSAPASRHRAGRPDRGQVAADLQEPPELIVEFDRQLRSGEVDVVVGQRTGRADPWMTRLFSSVFWGIYRRWIQRDVPVGGVDIFGCTSRIRDEASSSCRRSTARSSVCCFWIGFRRVAVPYVRRPRRDRSFGVDVRPQAALPHGQHVRVLGSPRIRLLFLAGLAGLATSVIYATVVVVAKLMFSIQVSG